MSDNAEEGIFRSQAAAAKAKGTNGLKDHHTWTIAYLDERIVVMLLAVAVIGLAVLWATTSSSLVLYGSFAVLILLVFLWGFARIKRIEVVKRQREELAESWKADDHNVSSERNQTNID